MDNIKLQEMVQIPFKVGRTDYGMLKIPAGTKVTHQTAAGYDENYHFIDEFEWLDRDPERVAQAKASRMSITSFNALIKSDMMTHGLNVPSDSCVDVAKMRSAVDVMLAASSNRAQLVDRIVDVEFVSHWGEGDVYSSARLDKDLGIISDVTISDNGAEYEEFLGHGMLLDTDGGVIEIALDDANFSNDIFLVASSNLKTAMVEYQQAKEQQACQASLGCG